MRQNAKHSLWQAFIALVMTSLATLLAPLSAGAESSIVGADQAAAAGEDAAPELLRANNGFDLTRPQTAFEVRGLDETSSNDTSEMNARYIDGKGDVALLAVAIPRCRDDSHAKTARRHRL